MEPERISPRNQIFRALGGSLRSIAVQCGRDFDARACLESRSRRSRRSRWRPAHENPHGVAPFFLCALLQGRTFCLRGGKRDGATWYGDSPSLLFAVLSKAREKSWKKGWRGIQRFGSRILHAKDAIKDTFLSTKNVFEQHKLVFTIGTSVLSAGAAWAGYVGRQVHQQHVENRLNSIENAMKSQTGLPEDEILAMTRRGVSFKTCFASVGTASVITYILGFRSGRKFTLARIEKQKQRLLLATNNPKVPISQRPIALKLQQRLNAIKMRTSGWRRKKSGSNQQKSVREEEELYPGCA